MADQIIALVNDAGNTGKSLDFVTETSDVGTVSRQAMVLKGTIGNNATRGKARDLAATVEAIKASKGTLYALHIENSQGAKTFIQIFDVAAGSVNLGTTVPDWTFEVAANAFKDVVIPAMGIPFGTAISIAATTAEKGASGSSSGVHAHWVVV